MRKVKSHLGVPVFIAIISALLFSSDHSFSQQIDLVTSVTSVEVSAMAWADSPQAVPSIRPLTNSTQRTSAPEW